MIEYKSISLADQVYEKLETSILNGTYQKGEYLSENRLVNELGVSRTPIREALNRLEYEKLIKVTPNGNMVVGISIKDVSDLFEIKRRIELLATRWAASNIGDEGLAQLKAIVDQQEYFAQKGDAIKVRDLDTEFHDLIYTWCGSPMMEGILSPIHHKLMKYRKASLEIEDRIMDSVQEHKAIYEALANHDRDKVDALMMVHIEHAFNCILQVNQLEMEKKKAGEEAGFDVLNGLHDENEEGRN